MEIINSFEWFLTQKWIFGEKLNSVICCNGYNIKDLLNKRCEECRQMMITLYCKFDHYSKHIHIASYTKYEFYFEFDYKMTVLINNIDNTNKFIDLTIIFEFDKKIITLNIIEYTVTTFENKISGVVVLGHAFKIYFPK
jgi:hypothetical protein